MLFRYNLFIYTIMIVAGYPTEKIHLPSHLFSIRITRAISLIGGLLIACSTFCLFLGWLLKIEVILTLFGSKLCNLPTIVALTGCCIAIFMYNSSHKILFLMISFVNLWIGLFIVLSYFFHLPPFFSLFSTMSLRAGVIFVLLGYSQLIGISPAQHRFHYLQLILFIALFLGLFGFLESVYLLISTGQFISIEENSLAGSILLFTLTQSFLLAKTNRGFLGLFTTDTNSSQLARFSLIYYAILPPMLGILLLVEEKVGFLNSYGRLAFLILSQMLISVIITWINIKLLYPSEVENYLTKEALRINSVTLALDAKELSSKIDEVEKTKKALADKLNNRDSLIDYVDKFD